MKRFNYLLTIALLVLASLLLTTSLYAQQTVEYRQLARQNQQRSISVDLIVLPGSSESTVTMATVFSLPYNVLPFKKVSGSAPQGEFYSVTELSMEVFKSAKSKLKSKKELSVKGLESVTRSFWSDTAYAKNYEESQSPDKFLNGTLKATLPPGVYSYILQLRRGQQTESRISKVRTVELKPYGQMETGNVILGENVIDKQQPAQFILSSLGKNVRYAEDFYALVYLPGFDKEARYTLDIKNLNVVEEDTSTVGTVYSKKLSEADFSTNIHPTLSSQNKDGTRISLKPSETGYDYALVKIPGKQLPNAMYELTVKKQGSKKPIARSTFRSIWVDIPTSLLSLDVAIEMLRYIADQKTINNLKTGSQKKREQKFRSFWEKRDPTPNTEYNEIMAEYYKRIDYAYKNFTTTNNLGYNSDQGKVYIKYGPPKNIERKFPTNAPTMEIWTYDSRKFVFQATSGFGDFKLVSEKSN